MSASVGERASRLFLRSKTIGRTVLLLTICLLFSCKKQPAFDPANRNPILPTPIEEILSEINGSIALQKSLSICAFGSRSFGSPGHSKIRSYIAAELARLGWKIIEQKFDAVTPAGNRSFVNLIAQFPPSEKTTSDSPTPLLLVAHYDARGSQTVTFPTASAGAAGCGVLLEIAERLAPHPELARQVQLVFLDGEEPVRQISATDGLWGSQFFIHSLSENGQLPKIRALLALGAIGHANAHWHLPSFTTPDLNLRLKEIAAANQWENQISDLGRPNWGSYLAAFQAGIPSACLNDALYPALATADDDARKLDQESLRRVVITALQLLQKSEPALNGSAK